MSRVSTTKPHALPNRENEEASSRGTAARTCPTPLSRGAAKGSTEGLSSAISETASELHTCSLYKLAGGRQSCTSSGNQKRTSGSKRKHRGRCLLREPVAGRRSGERRHDLIGGQAASAVESMGLKEEDRVDEDEGRATSAGPTICLSILCTTSLCTKPSGVLSLASCLPNLSVAHLPAATELYSADCCRDGSTSGKLSMRQKAPVP